MFRFLLACLILICLGDVAFAQRHSNNGPGRNFPGRSFNNGRNFNFNNGRNFSFGFNNGRNRGRDFDFNFGRNRNRFRDLRFGRNIIINGYPANFGAFAFNGGASSQFVVDEYGQAYRVFSNGAVQQIGFLNDDYGVGMSFVPQRVVNLNSYQISGFRQRNLSCIQGGGGVLNNILRGIGGY